jgi:hypothetical protein
MLHKMLMTLLLMPLWIPKAHAENTDKSESSNLVVVEDNADGYMNCEFASSKRVSEAIVEARGKRAIRIDATDKDLVQFLRLADLSSVRILNVCVESSAVVATLAKTSSLKKLTALKVRVQGDPLTAEAVQSLVASPVWKRHLTTLSLAGSDQERTSVLTANTYKVLVEKWGLPSISRLYICLNYELDFTTYAAPSSIANVKHIFTSNDETCYERMFAFEQ